MAAPDQAAPVALQLRPDLSFIGKLGSSAGDSFRSCYQCGTCSVVCPFAFEGTHLPRKEMLLSQWGLKDERLSSPNLWICTTCGNCARLCPREVDIPGTIRAARGLSLLEGTPPPELAQAFANLQRQGNPQGESPRKRVDWAAEAGVPVPLIGELGRPGGVPLYGRDHQNHHPPRGGRRRGSPARLAGETGLFELLAEQNIKAFGKYAFARLVVMDPHAYNAFRNHYPRLGWTGEVLHYTQFLAEHVERIAWRSRLDLEVTYHDPCYLGRNNGEYDAPRKLLAAIPGVRLAEMPHNRANGYCCGGGGGGMWLDGFVAEHVSERLSERRVREAVATVGTDGSGGLSGGRPPGRPPFAG